MTVMTVRMPDELSDRLRAEAEATGQSANAAVLIAIDEWLAKRADEHVAAAFEKVAQRDRDLLHRLGAA